MMQTRNPSRQMANTVGITIVSTVVVVALLTAIVLDLTARLAAHPPQHAGDLRRPDVQLS